MNTNAKLEFKLTIEEVNVVLQGLGELPAKNSMQLITSIQNQAAAQMQPQVSNEESTQE